MKRLLASLLCATLILSPVGNASTVYATETAEVIQQVQETEEGQQDTDDVVAASEEDAVGASDEQEEKETAAEADETGADSSEADGADEGEQKDESTSGDEAATDVVPSEEEAVTDPEAAEDAGTEENEALADDAAMSETATEEAAETEKVEIEEADDLLGYNEDCFEVEDGVLRLKEGETIGSSVMIPAEARVIPAGLFNVRPGKDCQIIEFEENSQLVSIEAGAFSGSGITEIEIPTGVTTIEAETFSGATALKSVTFLGNIESIGNRAFYDNKALTSITASYATSVGEGAFQDCDNLFYVSMPSLRNVADSAFEDCKKLSVFTFAKNLMTIGSKAFKGCGFAKVDLSKIPDDAEFTLGDGCFKDNASLTEVILPNCLETIPENAFLEDSKLSKVAFGTDKNCKLTVISQSAFGNCTSLNSILLHDVYVIQAQAFSGCTALTSVTIENADTNSPDFSIANDAFPDIKLTIYGCGGKVETYAKRKGYTYVAIEEKYKVSAEATKNKGTVNLSATEAAKGTKVRITVTPIDDYDVKDISIVCSVYVSKDAIALVENTEKYKVFELTMPGADVHCVVTIVKKGNTVGKDLTASFESVDDDYVPTPSADLKEWKFDYPGRQARLIILNGSDETNSWLWNFSSDNTKVATVSKNGIVRSVGAGNGNAKAVITATLKSDSTKKISITVRVINDAEITSIDLDFSGIKGADFPGSVNDGDEDIPVIRFRNYAVSDAAKSFDMGINITAKGVTENTALTVSSKWTTTDKNVAGLAASTSTTNSNTIKISKGATGEALVTVSVLNKDEKEPRASNIKRFIVQVIDPTPRLENDTLVVDSTSTDGTPISIVKVYGYEIAGNKLTVVDKDKSDNVPLTVKKEQIGDEVRYSIKSKKTVSQDVVYTNQLFLMGTYNSDDDLKGTQFYIPIKKLTVTSKPLNPTLKTSGRINLFYTYEDENSGVVKVTQSLKDFAIDKCELISKANYQKAGSEEVDSFASGFEVNKVDGTTFEITRSVGDVDKVVTSGYVKIWYVGFRNPVVKPITVPTSNKAPEYVIEDMETKKSSATANTNTSGRIFKLHLVDKKTKKVELDLRENLVDLDLDYDKTTKDSFEQTIFKQLNVADAKRDNYISLQIKDVPRKGKAVIKVRLSTWSKPISYTFSLSTTSALPTVKFDQTTVKLNTRYPSQEAKVVLTQNQAEAVLCEEFDSITYTGNKKNRETAEKLVDAGNLDFKYNKESKKLEVTFKLPAGENIPKGSYSYKVVPVVAYDGDGITTKAQNIKIVVEDTVPTLKFKNATFTFNAEDLKNNSGKEVIERDYQFGNLPTGVTAEDIELDTAGISYEPLSGAPSRDRIADIDFVNGKAIAKLTTKNPAYAGKTFKYKVNGMEVECGGDKAVIADFTISIRLNKKATSVKVTSKGTLNPIDTDSMITYTATLKNIVSEIYEDIDDSEEIADRVNDGVTVWEWDESGKPYAIDPDEMDTYYSEHFVIRQDSEKSNVAYLTVKPGQRLVNNKKYKIAVVYKLKANDKRYLAKFTITPKQTLPQITTDRTSATIYSGQTNKTFTVKIAQKNSKNLMNVTMETPVNVSSDALKKAFKVTGFDQATGTMTVTLVNPAAIVQNSTYTLNFETRYANQADKSSGNKFSVKVTVKK